MEDNNELVTEEVTENVEQATEELVESAETEIVDIPEETEVETTSDNTLVTIGEDQWFFVNAKKLKML